MPGWPWNRRHTPRHAAGPQALAASTSEQGYAANVATGWWQAPDTEETPELRWPANIEVYDRMRRQDAQVISVLRAITLPIRRTAWRIDPAGAPPEVVAFVAENLGLPIKGQDPEPPARTRDRFSWSEHLYLALLSLPFGHSVFEQVYRIEGGRAWIRKLGWRPPRTISKIDVAADGGLVAVEQLGLDGKTDRRMTVDRLVVYVNDREGGNWLGQSLLRPAYKFWLLKDRMLRVQAQSVDRNGMGVPVYQASETPAGLSDPEEIRKRQQDELAAGLKIARGMRSGDSAGAAVPHGAKVTLLGVEGTLPDAEKPIRYYDEQIARAVLAHFLNLGTETGSWALGSTFADFFTLSLQTVALSIADTATQHIVEDLVDLNFGPDVPAPRIVFDEIGSQQRITAQAIKELIDCGAIEPDEDLELYLRQAFALPAKGTPRATHEHDGDDTGAPPATPAATGSSEVSPDAAQARYAAEVLQKAYLAVGVVITQEEARDLARRAGAAITTEVPEQVPPAPDLAPPPDGDEDDPPDDASDGEDETTEDA